MWKIIDSENLKFKWTLKFSRFFSTVSVRNHKWPIIGSMRYKYYVKITDDYEKNHNNTILQQNYWNPG